MRWSWRSWRQSPVAVFLGTAILYMRRGPVRCNPTVDAASRRSARVDEIPGQRMREPAVGKRFARKELPKRQPAAVERVRGPGHVDAPHAELFLADFGAGSLG